MTNSLTNNNYKNSLVFLDTETTGLDLKKHRIIEIACVKVQSLDQIFTEEIFHEYLNPECEMDEESKAIHGLSKEFLADKPKFKDISDNFLPFIENCIIIAHNASFDIKFINKELDELGLQPLNNKIIDSLSVAKKLYPGSLVGLDALMKRFSMTSRNFHSALEDAKILKKIYSLMCSNHNENNDNLIQEETNTKQYSFSKKLIV